MRILFCNKYNHPFSGTEIYLFEAMELLRSRGHDVALFSMADPRGKPTPYDHHFVPHLDFRNQKGFVGKVRLAAHAIYSPDARRRIRAMIADFHPEVAHVRNIYHHLSPSILWEFKAQGIPVVYHLNDFKLLCPSYNLCSNGEVCEACKGAKFRHALRASCYPGLGSRITLTAEAYVHHWLGTYDKCVDRFLAPSHFVRDKFVEHGWDPEKFVVQPHFQRAQREPDPREHAPLLYFGRLSREKGVADLLHAMQLLPDLRLVIAGDGPERHTLELLSIELGLANVEFLGHLQGSLLDRALADSLFTVLPSHAYETLGKSILESYAHGRAVVASDLGSRRELVQDGETGLLYPTGDVPRLAAALRSLASRPQLAGRMGQAGYDRVRQRYTPEAHYEALVALYEQLIAEKRSSIHLPPSFSQKPRLRIAFIGGRGVISKYSGIETYYEEVGKRLAAMGHDVTVYCRTYFTPDVAEHEGMRLVRLPTIRSKHLDTFVHTLLSTIHALSQPYDIVHYHALGPALFAFIPRLFGKKTLVTVQGLDWQRKKWGRFASFILRLGERASASFPNGTMVVSQVLQQFYREHYGVEPFYVPNGGVLRDRRAGGKLLEWNLKAGNYVLFLGRFSPEKGCHLLIEAFELLGARMHNKVNLVLAGASSYCDEYSTRLRAHSSDRIRILDWVSGDALEELFTNAMIFVLPSDLEGLSLALLDAMGAGLCVLSSDVPENREVVEGAGYTFRAGDVEDLCERLAFLIENPAVRESAGRGAQRRIRDHYQWSQITSEIERAYFEVLDWNWVHKEQEPELIGEPALATTTSNLVLTTPEPSPLPARKAG